MPTNTPPAGASQPARNNARRDHHPARHQQHKIDSQISEHFNLKEFVCRCGRCDNSVRVSLGLVGCLEALWAKTHKKIKVVKGYACAETSGKKQGRKDYHTQGVAADIVMENMTSQELFLIAEEIPEITGLGLDLTDFHLHVDTRKDHQKRKWVVKNGSFIELTPENRSDFIQPVVLAK